MGMRENEFQKKEEKKKLKKNIAILLTLWDASYLYTTTHFPLSFSFIIIILTCDWILVAMKVKDN